MFRNAIFILLPICWFSFRPAQGQPLASADTTEYIKQTQSFLAWFRDSARLDKDVVLQDSAVNQSLTASCEIFLKKLDSATFAPEDRDIITAFLKHPLITVWSNSLIPNVRIIQRAAYKELFKTRQMGDAWHHFHKHYGNSIYTLGAPIFLHNYSICLFYSAYSCDALCGAGTFALYRKEGDKWVWVLNFGGWVS